MSKHQPSEAELKLRNKVSNARNLLNDGQWLSNFICHSQRQAMLGVLRSEEAEFMADKVLELVECINATPKTYQTEGVDLKDKVLALHYFGGSIDAWVIERDVGDTPEGTGLDEQYQAFGAIAIMGGGWKEAEWGYISIAELIENGIELDLYWMPKLVKEMGV